MARVRFPPPINTNTAIAAPILLIFLFVVVSYSPVLVVSSFQISDLDFNTTVILPDRGGGDSVAGADSRQTTMFLPLFLSPPRLNHSSSAVSVQQSRRHLQSRPNARMSLHDDLLLNGYYTTRLWIGTPPQRFALIVDTGSTVTYVPCSTCEQCGNHQDPRFQPELSTSYNPVKCNVDCTCDDERKYCTYDRQYAEMSSSSGILGEDIVSFGNLSELAPQRAVFGCENVETGDLYSQHADGIMGLGRGELSIVDQLVGKKVISDSFSLCYGGMDVGGGAMVLGGISPPPDMVYTRSDPARSPYYNIELKGMHVAGKALPVNPRVFDRKYGSVLDSGTTYAYLPEEAFTAFKAAIRKEVHSLKQIQGPDPNYKDTCFSGAGSDISQLSSTFPLVEMVFSNGQKLALSPENYLFRHSKVRGAYCLGIFQNGKDPTTLLGGIIVRNTLVTYDREHEKIGFLKTNCSDLWGRLHLSSVPPPSPSPSELDNKTVTAHLTPGLAPSEHPLYNASGEIKAGQVTFYMSSSVNYSDLKPHIQELEQLLSKELDVSTSQVHILNFTSKGNDSLIKWAIRPSGSAEFMSTATAMDIVSRLAENHVHLPNKYGSYNFFDWNIEPPQTRTRWLQNYVVVLGVFIVILIIGLAASGVFWFIRRRQESLVSYKPVDSAIPEQELQPLSDTATS